MRKDFLVGIFATMVAMATFYFYDQAEKKKVTSFEKEKNEKILEKIQTQSAAPIAALISADQTIARAVGISNGEPARPEDVQQVNKNFSEHLKSIGACLEIKASVDSETVDPTFDNLVVSLRPALGEVVVQMDDWTQRDLKNTQGERKRLRTEVNYQDGGVSSPVKHVQLYKLNEQGMPELQTLDAEQSVNPTDAYIESLRGDFETSLEEKGGRAYYQEGEELVMIERNGKLESVSISKGGKTASCSGLDSLKSNCQCL